MDEGSASVDYLPASLQGAHFAMERPPIFAWKGCPVCRGIAARINVEYSYGHPGIFVNPSHEAIKRARAEGYSANMLAAVSAEDCLFADLGIDPSVEGCQTFEATDFLVYKRQFDTTSSLIIWQIGCVGDLTFNPHPSDPSGINVLVDYLLQHYSPSQPAILYQANVLPICKPIIRNLTLAEVREADINQITTLYIHPVPRRAVDKEHLSKLGLLEEALA